MAINKKLHIVLIIALSIIILSIIVLSIIVLLYFTSFSKTTVGYSISPIDSPNEAGPGFWTEGRDVFIDFLRYGGESETRLFVDLYTKEKHEIFFLKEFSYEINGKKGYFLKDKKREIPTIDLFGNLNNHVNPY